MLLKEIMATGTYVAVLPTDSTLALLRAWADEQRIELDDHLHVTLLYSRKPVHVVPCTDEFVATGVSFDMFGDALVLKLNCPALDARHQELMDQGGTHDFPTFNPHITIQAKSKEHLRSDRKIKDIPLPPGLILNREYSEPLDP